MFVWQAYNHHIIIFFIAKLSFYSHYFAPFNTTLGALMEFRKKGIKWWKLPKCFIKTCEFRIKLKSFLSWVRLRFQSQTRRISKKISAFQWKDSILKIFTSPPIPFARWKKGRAISINFYRFSLLDALTHFLEARIHSFYSPSVFYHHKKGEQHTALMSCWWPIYALCIYSNASHTQHLCTHALHYKQFIYHYEPHYINGALARDEKEEKWEN